VSKKSVQVKAVAANRTKFTDTSGTENAISEGVFGAVVRKIASAWRRSDIERAAQAVKES
jgi:hypothetical protein